MDSIVGDARMQTVCYTTRKFVTVAIKLVVATRLVAQDVLDASLRRSHETGKSVVDTESKKFLQNLIGAHVSPSN